VNLLRLSQGKYINVCTQVGRSCGKVFFENGEDAASCLAAINTFYTLGLFDEEEDRVYGIRFSRLTNYRGQSKVKLILTPSKFPAWR
jgi:hypothetical protein